MTTLILILILASVLTSCEFEKANYYEYRYGENVDFGEDTGNQTGSSFGFGSSSSSSRSKSSKTDNRRLYWGDGGSTSGSNDTKTDYSRYYRGSNEDN